MLFRSGGQNLGITNIDIDFNDLLVNGVMVIPGPSNVRKGLKTFNKEQIEFVNPAEKECILGGFGAYGNPTSFHHPYIRNVRKVVHDYLWKSLSKAFPGKRAELLLDRFSKRRKGTTTSVETWHRDIAPVDGSNIKEGDIIYGGWINLDKKGLDPQGFSCVPGTQINDILKKGGFVKFSPEEMKDLNKKKKIFKIPPGHIIMFNQNIAHEILKKTSTFDSYRLFIGWRITDSKKPLFDNKKVIEDQGIIKLPSGQIPSMYSPSHWMFHRDKLVEWSERVKPEFKEEKLFKKEGIYLNVVQQHMISLRESGLQMWPEYSEYDKKILTPMKL